MNKLLLNLVAWVFTLFIILAFQISQNSNPYTKAPCNHKMLFNKEMSICLPTTFYELTNSDMEKKYPRIEEDNSLTPLIEQKAFADTIYKIEIITELRKNNEHSRFQNIQAVKNFYINYIKSTNINNTIKDSSIREINGKQFAILTYTFSLKQGYYNSTIAISLEEGNIYQLIFIGRQSTNHFLNNISGILNSLKPNI